jgi:hypothetical protein
MKLNRKNFLFGAAIIALVALMLGLALRTKPLATSNATSPLVQAKKEPAAPTDFVVRPEKAPKPTPATTATETTPEVQATTLQTPSLTSRPYIRMQINPDGTLEGIFATRCEPVKQARSPQAVDGYYYRLVSSSTGETLIDGTVAKPVIRHQHQGVDEHGVAYVVCPSETLNQPVFFDIPNVAARLEVYQTTPQSPLAATGLPLVKAVNLAPQ